LETVSTGDLLASDRSRADAVSADLRIRCDALIPVSENAVADSATPTRLRLSSGDSGLELPNPVEDHVDLRCRERWLLSDADDTDEFAVRRDVVVAGR
jgi:hypothetical protein